MKLVISLDASKIEGFKPEQPVQVLVVDRKGATLSKKVELNAKGLGETTFEFPQAPDGLKVLVGPQDASPEEMQGLQTISLDVRAGSLKEREVKLPPIVISSFYWNWWLRWCRIFTIRGHVRCANGAAVPGANVCAYDVDWWWFWISRSLVGCATTDQFGAFEIRFRWCCGWFPWWWWRLRYWQLEKDLASRITGILQRDPRLPRLPAPSPRPDLSLFDSLLGDTPAAKRTPLGEVDPGALAGLREKLVKRLPPAPELERLRIWPWWPWEPWWDCDPDIIFKVTQDCRDKGTVIVDETIWQVRPNIPTILDVTLTANEQACCIPDAGPGCGAGNCVVLTVVCDDEVDTIGGNTGAAPAPIGYLNPGLIATTGDRPYGGAVPISGTVECMSQMDYYEFEISSDGNPPWNPLSPASIGDFTRTYIDFSGPTFHYVTFSATLPIDGRHVYESRAHYEATHPPADWGTNRIWVLNPDLLLNWLTDGNYPDGTYYLRLRGWNFAGGQLVNSQILHECGVEAKDNHVVVTIDNRFVGATSVDGSGNDLDSHGKRCGSGSVHFCTVEPDTDIVSVLINGQPVGACTTINAKDGGTLDIDFVAHDPDGHLAYYTVEATYGENLAINLLGVPGATLTASPVAVAGVPPAAQVGPTYAAARTLPQTAAAPTWNGGVIRLGIPDLRNAFPETCCYQLVVRAFKRTVVDCYDGFGHYNTSELSFTVIV
jgi:hypothetical protein